MPKQKTRAKPVNEPVPIPCNSYDSEDYWLSKHDEWLTYCLNQGIDYAAPLLKRYLLDVVPASLLSQFNARLEFKDRAVAPITHTRRGKKQLWWIYWRRIWPRAEQFMQDKELITRLAIWVHETAKSMGLQTTHGLEQATPYQDVDFTSFLQLAFRDTLRLDDPEIQSLLKHVGYLWVYDEESCLRRILIWCNHEMNAGHFNHLYDDLCTELARHLNGIVGLVQIVLDMANYSRTQKTLDEYVDKRQSFLVYAFKQNLHACRSLVNTWIGLGDDMNNSSLTTATTDTELYQFSQRIERIHRLHAECLNTSALMPGIAAPNLDQPRECLTDTLADLIRARHRSLPLICRTPGAEDRLSPALQFLELIYSRISSLHDWAQLHLDFTEWSWNTDSRYAMHEHHPPHKFWPQYTALWLDKDSRLDDFEALPLAVLEVLEQELLPVALPVADLLALIVSFLCRHAEPKGQTKNQTRLV